MLKFRLFCYVSGILMMAGLLLPVGVYADKSWLYTPTPPSEATMMADDTPCLTSAVVAGPEAPAYADALPPASGQTPKPTAACEDDEDSPASGSWNS